MKRRIVIRLNAPVILSFALLSLAALLLGGNMDYEFRTTVCAPLHTPEAMVEIGQWLQGAKRYFLQPFVDPGALLGSGVTSLSHEAISALRCSVLPYIPSTQIRGE